MFYSPFGFNALFGAISLLVIAIFVFILAKNIGQRNKDSNAPRLTVECVIADKRTETATQQMPVGGDISGAHGFHVMTDTTYHVTFQVESGDRIEFSVSGSEYACLARGMQGKLTFQGTRYLGFEQGDYGQ